MKNTRWSKRCWVRLRSADTLRALIRQKGLSYSDVARFAGCHKSFIGAMASPTPDNQKRSCSQAKAEAIALLLDVPLNVLFEDKPTPKVPPQPKRRSVPNGVPAT